MNTRLLLKVIRHLKDMNAQPIVNKIFRAMSRREPVSLTKKEQEIFNVVRHDLLKSTKLDRDIPKKFGVEDMKLRRELFYNPRESALSPGYFTSSRRTPMVDIDLPSASHQASQVMVQNPKEFMQLARDYMKTKAGKKSALKLYETPAGIRVFDISKAHRGTKPYTYEGVANELGGDPFYINFSKIKGTYDARVFPKPGRSGDFVARPMGSSAPNKVWMGPDAEISRRGWNEMLVHDALIRAIMHNTTKNKKISVGGLLDLTDLSSLHKAFR
jgi:hypothetical protein|tara:strand:- start:755 stop:1570 length:816 start_codon:yes stop_codon:yes gene_type:complete